MLMSTDRILVSHVGSLPRPPTLSELLIRQEAGETIDAAEFARQVEIATTHVIDKQVEAGVDVGSDGEQSRVGFQTYVSRCLCGFGGESRRPPSRDQIDFPSYARQTELRFPHSARVANAPAALSDVQYQDSAPINEDAAARINTDIGAGQTRLRPSSLIGALVALGTLGATGSEQCGKGANEDDARHCCLQLSGMCQRCGCLNRQRRLFNNGRYLVGLVLRLPHRLRKPMYRA